MNYLLNLRCALSESSKNLLQPQQINHRKGSLIGWLSWFPVEQEFYFLAASLTVDAGNYIPVWQLRCRPSTLVPSSPLGNAFPPRSRTLSIPSWKFSSSPDPLSPTDDPCRAELSRAKPIPVAERLTLLA